MKKLLATTLVLATLLVTCTAASAHHATAVTSRRASSCGTVRACQFVDANKDGICDLHGTACRFVDANGDGICDSCPNGGVPAYNGSSAQTGRSHHCRGGNCRY